MRPALVTSITVLMSGCGEEDAPITPSSGCATPATLYFDADGDGYGVASVAQTSCEAAPNYVATAGDCDDISPEVHPGQAEICNGVDDNCDGEIDPEGTPGLVWSYADQDGDGYGDPTTGAWTCGMDAGRVDDSTDCDDTEALAWEDAEEVCGDGVDNNCDGTNDTCVLPDSGGFAELGLPRVQSLVHKAETGASMATLDFTGDGQIDLIVGSPRRSDSSSRPVGALAVHAAPVPDGVQPFTNGEIIWGVANMGGFATAMTSLDDINGDGYSDLLVSAPDAAPVRADLGEGSIHALLGPVSSAHTLVSTTTYATSADTSQLGSRLLAGDFNGDAAMDALASVAGGPSGSGGVWLFSPQTDGTVSRAPEMLSEQAAMIRSDQPSADVGQAIADVGDIDGDGVADFAIGAPGWTTDHTIAGAVAVFFGVPTQDSLMDEADIFFTSEEAQACGSAIAGGDVDADGRSDLAVTCSRTMDAGVASGVVSVFLSPSPGALLLDQAVAQIRGTSTDDVLGHALSMSDMNGDGQTDLAAIGPDASTGVSGVHLWSGTELSGVLSTDDASASWWDESGGAGSGRLQNGADLTGDGADDLLAGFPYWSEGRNAGELVVIPGTLGL